ncbi:MAG: MFS transporter [Gammaproteobacteria bacterium]|nr:MFS transporter [Gammaproteobacteria bacterium]
MNAQAEAQPQERPAEPADPIDRSMFASLKVADYRYLWIGMVGSAFAMNMQLVAQGWLVYEMTVSAMNLAWVTLAFMIPQIAFSLLGGVLADRLKKKPVIMWAQLLNGVATLVMAFIVITGNVTFWDFIWVSAFNGTVLALSMPARTAFIPEIVGEALMFNAMAFNTASWNLSRILGPALAGLMIAVFADGNTSSEFGVGLVYFVLSGLYFISSFTVLLMHHDGFPVGKPTTSHMAAVGEGLRYVIHSPIVGGLILLSIMPFLFGLTINTLLPAFNTDILGGGPKDLGFLMTAMGVGAIGGSLALAKLGQLRHKGFWLFTTCALWGVTVAWFGISETVFWATLTVGLVGFISAINMSMNRSIVQLQVSQAMRGRIVSIDMMSHGLMPLGLLPISWIAERHGVQSGLVVSGILLLVITLLLWVFLPKVRRIDDGFEKLE